MKASFWHVWTMPLLLGGVSLVGLLAALVGDGLFDIVSWVSLAVPLGVIGWFVGKPRRKKRR